MSIKSAPYYWLECDGLNEDGTVCVEKSTEGGDFAAWADEAQALDDATNSDWDTEQADNLHYCYHHRTDKDEE